jgi:hypothetical protein
MRRVRRRYEPPGTGATMVPAGADAEGGWWMSGTGRRARWGQQCAMCSVMVVDGQGKLGGGPGGWMVLCGRCEDLLHRIGQHRHGDGPLPAMRIDKAPSNTGPRIWLRAYAVQRPCSSCATDAPFVAGVFPVFPAGGFGQLVLVTTDSAWRLAKQLLERSQVAADLAACIRSRPDPTGGVAGGCPECRAAYSAGSDPEVRATLAEHGLRGLTSIASAECSVVKWHRALYDPQRILIRIVV